MLSTTSEYALRALAMLARVPRGHSLLGRELAEGAEIPPQYLSKIMLALRNAGLVTAVRGAGGGYSLLRPADAIHLTDVVQLFDGPAGKPMCLMGPSRECSEKYPCSAHTAWAKVRDSYQQFLEGTTLQEISIEGPHPTQVTLGGRRVHHKAPAN